MEKRYEIFISSTFRDLIEERQIIKNIIIQQDNFPSGMEWFVGGRPPWHHIEKAIKSCDYYILMVGGFYGSINPKSEPRGLSFTECEYRLAQELGKEILLLILSDEAFEKLPPEKREGTKDKINKLKEFRDRIMREHTVIQWNNPDDLKTRVSERISIWLKQNQVKDGGWIRFRELNKIASRKQVLTYLFDRLNPYDNVFSEHLPYDSLTIQLFKHLDEKLDSIADVINVLKWLIETYVKVLIDEPVRVYFAYSLNNQHIAKDWQLRTKEKIEVPRYRLGISNSKEGAWQEGSIVVGNSNIHNVYCTREILAIEDSTQRTTDPGHTNIPVGGEGSVIAAPVYGISPTVPIGVVGINSPERNEAPNYRGWIKELSALFSSLFYAYCIYLKQEKDLSNQAHKNSTEKAKTFNPFGRFFRKEQPQPNKNDLLTYRIRKEIAEHFSRVLPEAREVIE